MKTLCSLRSRKVEAYVKPQDEIDNINKELVIRKRLVQVPVGN